MEYIAITGHKRELHFLKQEPPVRFRLIAEEEKGFQIKIPPLQLIRGGDRPYVKLQQSIYQCSDDFYAGAGEFLKLADEKKETSYHIARKDMPAFCGACFLNWMNWELQTGGNWIWESFSLRRQRFPFIWMRKTGGLR